VANNDSATTDEDIPVSMEVLANDSDIDSSSLTVSIESMPSDGTATVNPDNTITYTPNADFNGPDSFQYRLSDGSLEVVAQVDITVGPVNDAPVANDDIDSVQEDDSVTTNVVANDGDTENETLAVTITSSPSNGVATENGDGTVTYTPNANFNGADSYQYTVNDGNADSNTATVTITIAPVNDAPVAADDADSTAEDTAVTTDVLANDTDLDGDSLTVSSTGPAGDGSVVNNGDGTVTYIPTPDFNGPDSFVYTIDDGNGGTATATVYVEISSVNDTPVADDQSVSTDEDTPVSITLTGSDVDGNSLTFNIVDQPTNGTLSGTAPDLTYTPNADFNGSDSFTLTVNDGNADSSIATVSITVNAANDQPTADNQSVTTDEDTQVSITLTGSDTEDGTSLTYSLTSSPASGILSGTAPDLAYTPNANFNGADEFKFKVTDSESLESTEATVSITVNSVNDNPVANDDSGSTAEDTPVTIDVLANDLDVDGNSLFVESVSTATDGSVVNNGDGTVTYTPNVDFAGADFFTYNINDGNGGTATATVTVSVGGVNDSPTVNDDSETTSEDTPVTMSVLVNDGDIDGDSLTVTSTSDPTNGSAVVNIDNTVTYTPNANFNGSDSFTYDVSDGNGGTATATVNISVSAVNDAPVALDTSEVVDEDGTLFLTVSASDIDGDSLTFEVVSDPANGVLTGSGPDYTYTPNPDFTGSDSFTFKANDGSTDSNTTTVSITVQGPTDATRPLVSISSPANGGSINGPTSGVTVNLSGTASDSGSGIQIVEVRTETSGYSTVTTSDGYATWTKSITFKTAGAHQLVARATDNAGNMQWHVINVDIAMTVDVTRPVVTVTIPVNGNTLSGPAGAVVVDVSGTSSDFNTGVQIVEVRTDASAYSSATTSDGYSTWTKSVTFTTTGSHQIVARATDNAGNMQWHVINVDIVFTP
jgi:2C-methyl-D-erythritol 2,4-cyclodiphosphate synthase